MFGTTNWSCHEADSSCVALLLTVGANHVLTQDIQLSGEEFQSMIVGQTVVLALDDGKNYEMELAT